MPLKGGRMTRKEIIAAHAYAQTHSQQFAQHQAKLSSGGISDALQRPAVLAEIARLQQEIIFNDILPLAVRVHRDMLENEATPAGARAQLVKLAYDRAFGDDDAAKAKAPEEMTPDELSRAINELERLASAKARPINDSESDIFG
jgi:hypothetical protein